MTRTKLANRVLPDYTKGEEIANMVTHIIGAVFGVVALVFCVIFAAKQGDPFRIASSPIYGASLILLYTMSSVYHGLRPNMKKRNLAAAICSCEAHNNIIIAHGTVFVNIKQTLTIDGRINSPCCIIITLIFRRVLLLNAISRNAIL